MAPSGWTVLLVLTLLAPYARKSDCGSWGVHREELNSVFNHTLVEELRTENEDLPLQCRKDVCEEETIDTGSKGVFHWPYAVVDTKVRLRCPYSYDDDDVHYAERRCELADGYPKTSNVSAWWTFGDTRYCTYSPFVVNVFRAASESGKERHIDWYLEKLDLLHGLWKAAPDDPLVYDAITDWMWVLSDIVEMYGESSKKIPSDVVQKLLEVSSYVIEERWWLQLNGVRLPTKQMWMSELIRLPELMTSAEIRSNPLFVSDNIVLQIEEVTSSPAEIPLRKNFLQDGTFLVPEVNVSIALYDTAGLDGFESAINFLTILVFRDAIILVDDDNIIDPMFIVELEPPLNLPVPQPSPGVPTDGVNTSSSVGDGHSHTRPKRDSFRGEYDLSYQDYKTMGPLIYVSVETRTVDDIPLPPLTVNEITVDVVSRPSPFIWAIDNNDTRCGRAPEQYLPGLQLPDYSLDFFYNTGCEAVSTKGELTHCRCRGGGFISLFAWLDYAQYVGVEQGPPGTEDAGSFLGFPHNEVLYYIAMVLRIISLICLLATMLTFLVFRKVRRGTATLILLNLCAALSCMMIMFFIAEPLAENKIGCCVANVLRYYLVMVTLLWSGVEAVNMYLKLVKVFNSDISHFVLKSAAIAWGVPVLMIAVAMIVDLEAFDGFYDDCRFRCSLRDTMLYFGYLLPMCLLIAANLVVFVLVYRALHRHQKHVKAEGNKARLMRFVGSVSMLILLGVPWIFSAFGAINADGDEQTDLKVVEGVFHVVFVLFLNLQGVFIFMFHCVRNSDIRQRWVSMVTSAVSTTDTSLEMNRKTQSNASSKSTKSTKSARTTRDMEKDRI